MNDNRQAVGRTRRRGAALFEVALIAPIAFLFVLTMVAGGMAVFRLHQVQILANEGARWASVNGPKQAKRLGKPLPGKDDVYEHAIRPLAASMRPEQLEYDVEWNDDQTIVSVTVTYRWMAPALMRHAVVRGFSQLPISN